MHGYKSHIQPPAPVEAYMYPLHLIKEKEYECVRCEHTFTPIYTYDEEVTDHHGPYRRDTISFKTKCTYCGKENEYDFYYYYD